MLFAGEALVFLSAKSPTTFADAIFAYPFCSCESHISLKDVIETANVTVGWPILKGWRWLF